MNQSINYFSKNILQTSHFQNWARAQLKKAQNFRAPRLRAQTRAFTKFLACMRTSMVRARTNAHDHILISKLGKKIGSNSTLDTRSLRLTHLNCKFDLYKND